MRRLFKIDLKDYDGCSKVFRRPSVRAVILKGDKIALVYADIDEAIRVNGEYRSDVYFNEVMIGRDRRVLELIRRDKTGSVLSEQ